MQKPLLTTSLLTNAQPVLKQQQPLEYCTHPPTAPPVFLLSVMLCDLGSLFGTVWVSSRSCVLPQPHTHPQPACWAGSMRNRRP